MGQVVRDRDRDERKYEEAGDGGRRELIDPPTRPSSARKGVDRRKSTGNRSSPRVLMTVSRGSPSGVSVA